MNPYNSNNQRRHKFGYLNFPQKQLYDAHQHISLLKRCNERILQKQMEHWEENKALFDVLPMCDCPE